MMSGCVPLRDLFTRQRTCREAGLINWFIFRLQATIISGERKIVNFVIMHFARTSDAMLGEMDASAATVTIIDRDRKRDGERKGKMKESSLY